MVFDSYPEMKAAVDDDNLDITAEHVLVLRNAGNIPLTVTRIASTSPDFSPDLSPPLPWVIAPEDTAAMTLAVGPGEGELIIETDAPGARRVGVPMSASVDLPPSVRFTAPADAATLTAGSTTTISAVATDAEEDPRSLRVAFESDVDGALWEGAPDGAGLASLRWVGPYQTAGDHALEATVTDRCGQSATAELGVCQDAGFTAENLDLTSWRFNGSARWDAANRWVELTAAISIAISQPCIVAEIDVFERGIVANHTIQRLGTTFTKTLQ
jgi:hypothetical protein